MSTLEAIKINQSSTAHRLKASFPVRRLRFDFTSSKRYWFNNDAYFTHLMNAMSAIFPQGELMLIEALRNIARSRETSLSLDDRAYLRYYIT